MPAADSPEQLPEKDFDPDQLNLRLRVTLAADRKAVDPVVIDRNSGVPIGLRQYRLLEPGRDSDERPGIRGS